MQRLDCHAIFRIVGHLPNGGQVYREESVMVLGKVLARGQVTLPREIRRAADIKPGDRVTFRVTKQGTVEIRALPRLTLGEALERYRIEEPIDWDKFDQNWQDEAVKDVLESPRE
jgi:AbrB family looped-hinge helix DNA binding protein